jgi:tetratricopeptide (TPR) repeat protein
MGSVGPQIDPGAAIPPELLERLREDLVLRRIESGMAHLSACRRLIESLDPVRKNAAAVLGYAAQWVDIGFADLSLIRGLLARFPKENRAALPLSDYAHLRMAEGLVALDDEEYETAVRHLEFVLSVAGEIRDKELVAIANFWIGRSLRTQGRYDDALSYTARGKQLALGLGHQKMAAVMQTLESWLMFQKGRMKDAARILKDAESLLGETDDYVLLGNIQSAYGRIARREGRYDEAVRRFAAAICEYKKREPRHRNLARTLVNMAFVKRLLAFRLSQKIDRDTARRARSGASGRLVAEERARLERLRAEAMAELDEARRIYGSHPQHRGAGAVQLNYGYLHLDAGELDRAGAEAAAAYQLGDEKKDYILMARARILECMVENARFEEEIGDPHRHAQLAWDFARDAVEYARHTQNQRLLARASIWQGLTLSNEFFADAEGARKSCETAESLLRSEGHDYLWEDLQTLKSRVVRSGAIESVLQEWSQGLVGDKTFQQITEEFAGIIIPKVWEREGRKVARVAKRLSISPKKVRRILVNLGLSTSPEPAPGAGATARNRPKGRPPS